MMRDRPIVIDEATARMLRSLLAARAATRHDHDQEHLHELSMELDRAVVLEPREMPANAVTMNVPVQVLDLQSGKRQEVILVSPAEADVKSRRISVLAPLGTALLGYRQGDEIEWLMPGGLRRLRIERVVRAPTSTGAGLAAALPMRASAH